MAEKFIKENIRAVDTQLKTIKRQMVRLHRHARIYQARGYVSTAEELTEYVAKCHTLLDRLQGQTKRILATLDRERATLDQERKR